MVDRLTPRLDLDSGPTDSRWWLSRQDGREPHEVLWRILDGLKKRQGDRRSICRRNAIYYGVDLEIFGLAGPVGDVGDSILQFNAAENVIDTILSKWSKNKVLPMVVTEGASWKERRVAKEANKFIEGIFEECGVFKNDPIWCIEALLFGTGVRKVVETQDGRVRLDKTFQWELSVDESEARYGEPRSLYQRHYIDRVVLLEMYKGNKRAQDLILRAVHQKEDDDIFRFDTTSDMVIVGEAWHKKSGPEAKDGRYVRFIKGGTLTDEVEEQWDDDDYPFVFLYTQAPVTGIWGKAVMSRLVSPQREFDKVTRKLQDCHDIMGVPRLLIPRGAMVHKTQIDDEISGCLEFDGPAPPTEWNAQPAHPDTYKWWDAIPDNMLRFLGVSEMSSEGNIPRGMEGASGKAIEMMGDTESERLSVMWQCRENAYVELAEKMLFKVKDISERDGGYTIRASDGKALSTIDYKDIDIDTDKRKIMVFPTNLLSKTPSARYAELSVMRDRGDIDTATFQRLSGVLDLESESQLTTSFQEIVDKNIDAILSDGMAITVEPFDPFETILDRGVKAYNLARLQGAEPDRLDMLREYIEGAQARMAQMSLPPPMPPGGPGGPPPPIAPPIGAPPGPTPAPLPGGLAPIAQ